jgi:hypothetical protein
MVPLLISPQQDTYSTGYSTRLSLSRCLNCTPTEPGRKVIPLCTRMVPRYHRSCCATYPSKNYQNNAIRGVGLALMGVVLLLALTTVAWVYLHRDHRVLRAAQPLFLTCWRWDRPYLQAPSSLFRLTGATTAGPSSS